MLIKLILRRIWSLIRGIARRVFIIVSCPIRYFSEKIAIEGIVKYFDNKSCVIFGPNSILSDELKKKVIKCDVCVFVNKGYRKELFRKVKGLNPHCVLFHCLHPSETVGGGRINAVFLRFIGIKEIFYPLLFPGSKKKVNGFHAKNLGFLKLYTATSQEYDEVIKDLDNYDPNTGTAAICLIAVAKNVKLYVSGFTFYRTNYLPGYHSHLNSLSDTIALIEKYGSHNPDLDFLKFKDYFQKYNIQVDSELEKVLSEKYTPIFYQKKF